MLKLCSELSCSLLPTQAADFSVSILTETKPQSCVTDLECQNIKRMLIQFQ